MFSSNGWFYYPHGITTEFPFKANAAIPYPARRAPILSGYMYDADLAALESLFERRAFAEISDSEGHDDWLPLTNITDWKIFHLLNLSDSHSESFWGFHTLGSAQFFDEHPYGREFQFVDKDTPQALVLPFNLLVSRYLTSSSTHWGGIDYVPKGCKYADLFERVYGVLRGGIGDIIHSGRWTNETQDLLKHSGGYSPSQNEFFWAGWFPPGRYDVMEAWEEYANVPFVRDDVINAWWSFRNCDFGLTETKAADADPSVGRSSLRTPDGSFLPEVWWTYSPTAILFLSTAEGRRAKIQFAEHKADRADEYTQGIIRTSTQRDRANYFVNAVYGVGDTRDINYWAPYAKRVIAHRRAVLNAAIDAMRETYAFGMSFETTFRVSKENAEVTYEVPIESEMSDITVRSDSDVSTSLTDRWARQKDDDGYDMPAQVHLSHASSSDEYKDSFEFSASLSTGSIEPPTMTFETPYAVDLRDSVDYYNYPSAFEHFQHHSAVMGHVRGTIAILRNGELRPGIGNNRVHVHWGYEGEYDYPHDYDVPFIRTPVTIPHTDSPKLKFTFPASLFVNCKYSNLMFSHYGYYPDDPHRIDPEDSKPFIYPIRHTDAEQRVESIACNHIVSAYVSDKETPNVPTDDVEWIFKTLKTESAGGVGCVKRADDDAYDAIANEVARFWDEVRARVPTRLDCTGAYPSGGTYAQDGEWVDEVTGKMMARIAQLSGGWRWNATWDFDRGYHGGEGLPNQGVIDFEFEAHLDEDGQRVCTEVGYWWREDGTSSDLKSHGTLFVYPNAPEWIRAGETVDEASGKGDVMSFECVRWNWVTKLDPSANS